MDDPTRYFTAAVDEVLGGYLSGLGFERHDQSQSRVTYQRHRTMVSFAFFSEDLPTPWVAVDVGLLEPDGSARLAGLWRALADDEPARQYTSGLLQVRLAPPETPVGQVKATSIGWPGANEAVRDPSAGCQHTVPVGRLVQGPVGSYA